ncbi:MAG TPA: spermidine/putrescine ABC transporter substrate-binding protein [Solirubrobacterales bacterium]|nr:spermidine/putrescine ABC transporter substrate-binding protein [Solirubrobacterales bacterium]
MLNAWGRTDGAGPPNGRVPGLRLLIIAGLALAASLAIAACGGGDDGGIESGSGGDVETVQVSGKPSGDLTISNWPLYIDKQTVPDFEKATGVSVKYIEDVNDNVEFFGKVQPLLAKGESGGRSIMVVTDWMAKKMYDLGYVQNLDKSAIPNVEKNIVPSLRGRPFDPNNDFAVPWQSGMTGLVVRTDLAPDIKSICDLFDPKYKGKVDMLTEMRDTVPLVMKCEGVDLSQATEQDWLDAIDKIGQAADDGQIRRFTGNDYARDLTSGDAVAVIGWSGDAIQLQADNPDIKFVMPKEGCMLWSDNMVIPVGAPNPTAAEAWMNYVYDPKNQAQITDWNYYVSPVSGVKEILQKIDPPAAKSELIFPSEQFTAKCDAAPPLTGEEETKVTQAFNAVVSG